MFLLQLAQASTEDGDGVSINVGLILLVLLAVAAVVWYLRRRGGPGDLE